MDRFNLVYAITSDMRPEVVPVSCLAIVTISDGFMLVRRT